ncbi:uncharacterized protein LOC103098224 isoform X1 [Monodelphis domestica]|uniref:uncharacterized protein LOC103098224 isoform X1 n=1 Tax=Monodelphis domestica TaxID=13616 RepID=UPI0024E2640F|nr:uncharacterized protein LOC103098224 isoform X1 [Monodelphis domestica]
MSHPISGNEAIKETFVGVEIYVLLEVQQTPDLDPFFFLLAAALIVLLPDCLILMAPDFSPQIFVFPHMVHLFLFLCRLQSFGRGPHQNATRPSSSTWLSPVGHRAWRLPSC